MNRSNQAQAESDHKRAHPDTNGRDTLYFDGACGLCQGTTRFLRRLDWLGRLEFADMNTTSAESLPVSWDDAMKGIPMRTREGGVLVGYNAVRRALLQTPLGAPAGLVMWIPGVSWVGRRVYTRIAENRARQACDVASGADND